MIGNKSNIEGLGSYSTLELDETLCIYSEYPENSASRIHNFINDTPLTGSKATFNELKEILTLSVATRYIKITEEDSYTYSYGEKGGLNVYYISKKENDKLKTFIKNLDDENRLNIFNFENIKFRILSYHETEEVSYKSLGFILAILDGKNYNFIKLYFEGKFPNNLIKEYIEIASNKDKEQYHEKNTISTYWRGQYEFIDSELKWICFSPIYFAPYRCIEEKIISSIRHIIQNTPDIFTKPKVNRKIIQNYFIKNSNSDEIKKIVITTSVNDEALSNFKKRDTNEIADFLDSHGSVDRSPLLGWLQPNGLIINKILFKLQDKTTFVLYVIHTPNTPFLYSVEHLTMKGIIQNNSTLFVKAKIDFEKLELMFKNQGVSTPTKYELSNSIDFLFKDRVLNAFDTNGNYLRIWDHDIYNPFCLTNEGLIIYRFSFEKSPVPPIYVIHKYDSIEIGASRQFFKNQFRVFKSETNSLVAFEMGNNFATVTIDNTIQWEGFIKIINDSSFGIDTDCLSKKIEHLGHEKEENEKVLLKDKVLHIDANANLTIKPLDTSLTENYEYYIELKSSYMAELNDNSDRKRISFFRRRTTL